MHSGFCPSPDFPVVLCVAKWKIKASPSLQKHTSPYTGLLHEWPVASQFAGASTTPSHTAEKFLCCCRNRESAPTVTQG